MTTSSDDAWLIALGAEVSDGRPVDWEAAERRASDPATRRVVAELRRLAAVISARQARTALADDSDEPPARAPHVSQSATSWGHLVTLEQVGAGAFGSVYRAWDTRLDREVALKLLRKRPGTARPPLEEARLLARVRHPNVVSVYGADEDEQAAGIWMEFIEGSTLADLVAAHGPMSAREAAGIGLDLCRALAALHAAGLTHRDIKAQNVMREVGGRIVLMDFSGARGTGDPAERDLLGTPLYMAPELFEGRTAGTATEIYSLGVLLFFLLTGRHPVEGATLQDVRRAHQAGERVTLRELRPELAGGIVQLVERATARDLVARYRTAADLEHALLGVLGGVDRPHDERLRRAPAGAGLWTWRLAAAMGLVIASAAIAWQAQVRPPAAPMVRFSLGPPFISGSWPRVSPDGRWIVYGAPSEGRTVLWLRRLDADEPRALAGTSALETPFWSSDSRTLAFFADERLKRVNVDGSRAQVLAPAPQPRGGSWNGAGLLVFAPTPVAGLHTVRADGTGLTRVTQLDTEAGEFEHSWPEFLPDGRRFLYMARNRWPERSGIFLASLDAPGRTRVMDAHSRVAYDASGHLLYVRAGLLVARRFDPTSGRSSGQEVPVASGVMSHREGDGAFDVSPAGVLVFRQNERLRPTRLVLVDRAGRALQEIGAPAIHRSPRFSPDGLRVVAQRATSDATLPDLWLFDLQRGLASRLTRHPAPDIRPAWSPDGRYIAFSSNRNGDYGVYRVRVDGFEDEVPLTDGDEGTFVEGWLPDGSALLVSRGREGVWRLPLDGSPSTLLRPVLADGILPAQPTASPDGRWMAYVSIESGRHEVYVEPLPPTGDRWQASAEGGGDPQWSVQGDELYFISGDGVLTAVDVQADARRFEIGRPRPLFRVAIPELHGPSDYAVSPDGQRFIVNTVVGEAPQPLLHVTVNWRSLLSR